MDLKTHLPQIRKLRGLSQESLAEQIGVSRQAVSKWETGEAMPDYVKLMALADALNVSMDELCGRSAPHVNTELPAIIMPEVKKNLSLPRIAVVCLLAVILLISGFGLGRLFPANKILPLPDAISAEGFDFDSFSHPGLSFHFIPSVLSEDYFYQVSLCDQYGNIQVFDASLRGGICFCTTPLKNGSNYTVTAIISNGVESRSVLLGRELFFDEMGASWSPT